MRPRNTNKRFLIVGEGQETEYNYFVGMRNRFRDRLRELATSVAVALGKGGSAKQIVQHAAKELRKFKPDPRRGDRVFLLLDTEGSHGNSSDLREAEDLAAKNAIEIVYSAPAFEYWLLCHFNNASRSTLKDCAAAIQSLDRLWGEVASSRYEKTDDKIFSRLSDRLDIARDQALAIDIHNLQTDGECVKRNPSSQVYELVARMLGCESKTKCPIAGAWESLKGSQKAHFQKGELLPELDGEAVTWRLTERRSKIPGAANMATNGDASAPDQRKPRRG